jgi:flagellar hook-associated protein 2
MAGTISFLGLSGDQDFNVMVDALVETRRIGYIQPLENWKTDWETKLEAISTIDTTLSSFYSTVREMDRVSEFMVRDATSTDETVLTASATSSAIMGTHAVTVNQLAQVETEVHQGIQNDIEYHSGVADQTASINDSGGDKTFIYGYDGVTRTITVSDADTLQNLRDGINADGGNPGITAKIVTSGGQDHLVLVETAPDGAKSITIDPDGDMTLDGSSGTTDFTADTFTATINASGGDKTFQVKYGSGAAVDITITTGETLEDLMTAINNSGLGIRASILNDGGTGSGARHLVLRGEETGGDYTIVLNSGSGTTLDGTGDTEDFSDGAGVFTETASAQNAQIRVDGFPSSGWIERKSNTISDVVDGLSMTLVDSGSVTVTVSADKEAIIEKVVAFTEAFNSVRSAIQDATSYDEETNTAGSLLGNYAVQIIKSRLDGLVAAAAPGFSDSADVYTNLQQLGFSTDVEEGSETQGLLELDTSELSDALDNDPDAVARLFAGYFDGITDDTRFSFSSSLSTATPGMYNVEVDTDTERGRFQLEGGEWGDWVDLDGSSGNYTLTGTVEPEKGIAMNITYAAGTGTHTTELRLRNGIVAELSDELTDLLSTSGPLSTLDEHYNDIIENIEDRIADEEKRLLKYEEMLKRRFARLDTYMGRMTQLSTAVAQMMNQQNS